MSLWLITISDQYYPCSGTRDWYHITGDEDESRRIWDTIQPSAGKVSCLIKITATRYSEKERK